MCRVTATNFFILECQKWQNIFARNTRQPTVRLAECAICAPSAPEEETAPLCNRLADSRNCLLSATVCTMAELLKTLKIGLKSTTIFSALVSCSRKNPFAVTLTTTRAKTAKTLLTGSKCCIACFMI